MDNRMQIPRSTPGPNASRVAQGPGTEARGGRAPPGGEALHQAADPLVAPRRKARACGVHWVAT